jgi:2-polyprenyl-3-methyl-5-hydroxy-6-metoxy-1,4-benzoquinol methylase
MTDITTAPQTDPVSIYRHRDALYASDMLITALKGFNFFTWLADGPQTIDSICKHFDFHQRPVDVMTTLFVAEGWLAREGESLSLSDTAREHLVVGSPWFIGPYFPKVTDRTIATDLLECLKTGHPANFASRKDHKDWHKAMETDAFAKEFTEMMDCRGVLLAQALAKNIKLGDQKKLLDIAGGSGVYACSLCAHNSELHATVLDKKPVDQIAAKAIADRGFSDQVDVVASDMLNDPLPTGYDVHLFSNVLHDWDIDVVKQLLAASAKTIDPGGLMVVHDTFLNREKTGPLHVAEYSVLLMHVTQGRCYSEKEISDWATEVGFQFIEHVPSAAVRSALVFKRT